MTKTPKIVISILIILLLIIGLMLYLFLTRQTLETTTTDPIARIENAQNTADAPTNLSTPSLGQGQNENQANVNFITGLENLTQSLQGTAVDGEIIIDDNQNLVPTLGLRRLFDYFLSIESDETEQTINERVEAYINSHTPEPAASTAVEIYHRYVAYLKELNNIQNQYGELQLRSTTGGNMDLSLMQQRQKDIESLQHKIFAPEVVTAFFGNDNQVFDYSVAIASLAQDETLDEDERQAAKQAYLENMPDSLMKERAEQQQNLDKLMQRTQALQRQGASDAQLFAMRAELVGVPAAERLAQVDKQNRDFDARFEQYQTAKQTIMTNEPDPTQQQLQLAALENELFSDAEKKRLTGYAQLKALEQQNN